MKNENKTKVLTHEELELVIGGAGGEKKKDLFIVKKRYGQAVNHSYHPCPTPYLHNRGSRIFCIFA